MLIEKEDLVKFIRKKFPNLEFHILANTPDLPYILENKIHGHNDIYGNFIRHKYIRLDSYITNNKIECIAPKITGIFPTYTNYILTDDLYKIITNRRINKLKKVL